MERSAILRLLPALSQGARFSVACSGMAEEAANGGRPGAGCAGAAADVDGRRPAAALAARLRLPRLPAPGESGLASRAYTRSLSVPRVTTASGLIRHKRRVRASDILKLSSYCKPDVHQNIYFRFSLECTILCIRNIVLTDINTPMV